MKSILKALLRDIRVGFSYGGRKTRHSRGVGVIVVALLVVLSALIARRGAFAQVQQSPLSCQAGALDTSFSSNGIVTTPIGTGDDGVSSVAIQHDGKIVVGGYSLS